MMPLIDIIVVVLTVATLVSIYLLALNSIHRS